MIIISFIHGNQRATQVLLSARANDFGSESLAPDDGSPQGVVRWQLKKLRMHYSLPTLFSDHPPALRRAYEPMQRPLDQCGLRGSDNAYAERVALDVNVDLLGTCTIGQIYKNVHDFLRLFEILSKRI